MPAPREEVNAQRHRRSWPPPEHAAMFGQCDSTHTVCNLRVWTISRMASYHAPDGSFTRSHDGFGSALGTRLMGLARIPSLMVRVS